MRQPVLLSSQTNGETIMSQLNNELSAQIGQLDVPSFNAQYSLTGFSNAHLPLLNKDIPRQLSRPTLLEQFFKKIKVKTRGDTELASVFTGKGDNFKDVDKLAIYKEELKDLPNLLDLFECLIDDSSETKNQAINLKDVFDLVGKLGGCIERTNKGHFLFKLNGKTLTLSFVHGHRLNAAMPKDRVSLFIKFFKDAIFS